MPVVCVVIPTRNRADLLPATVATAFAAATDPEVIIVDDASTDNTEEVCRSLRGVTYIRLPRQMGTSAARNAAIRQTHAPYIAFLDDDDLRLPGSIDKQLEQLGAATDSALICGRALIGDARYSLPTGWITPSEGFSGDVFWRLLEANYIATSTVVARRTALLDCGLFDPDLDMLEDYDLWIRMAEKYRFEYLSEPVSVYRARGDFSGQKTSDRASHDRFHGALHKRLLNLPRARVAPLRLKRRVHRRHMAIIYNSLIHDAAQSLLDGNVEMAKSSLWAAVRMKPFHPKAHGSLVWLYLRAPHLRYSAMPRSTAGQVGARSKPA